MSHTDNYLRTCREDWKDAERRFLAGSGSRDEVETAYRCYLSAAQPQPAPERSAEKVEADIAAYKAGKPDAGAA